MLALSVSQPDVRPGSITRPTPARTASASVCAHVIGWTAACGGRGRGQSRPAAAGAWCSSDAQPTSTAVSKPNDRSMMPISFAIDLGTHATQSWSAERDADAWDRAGVGEAL